MATDDPSTDPVNDAEALATAPAAMLGNLYAAIGKALADAAQNAVAAQQRVHVTAAASTTTGLATMYSMTTAALGIASKKELGLEPDRP
jgi:hypothetical protein